MRLLELRAPDGLPEDTSTALRERAVLAAKCAAAAGLAWVAADPLTASQTPYYAPMTAFLVMQPTVASSLKDGAQYLGAALLGVLVAVLLPSLGPAGALTVAAVVGAGILLGGLRGLGGEGVTVAFWALFALVVGGDDVRGYVATRLPEAAVGVAVGLAVHLLLLPPLRLRPADVRLRRLREDLSAVHAEMAGDLRGDWPPEAPSWGGRTVDPLVVQARTAVATAEGSLRLNLRGGRRRATAARQRAALDRLEQAALATRALSGLLLDDSTGDDDVVRLDPQVRPLLAEVLERAADLVVDAPGPDVDVTGERARSAVRALRDGVVRLAHTEPRLWFTEGAVVVQADRLVRALGPSHDGVMTGPRRTG